MESEDDEKKMMRKKQAENVKLKSLFPMDELALPRHIDFLVLTRSSLCQCLCFSLRCFSVCAPSNVWNVEKNRKKLFFSALSLELF